MTSSRDYSGRMSRDEKIGAVCMVIIAIQLILLIGIGIGKSVARPGDRLTCVRDYTGTCAEPEPPKDPCGGKR